MKNLIKLLYTGILLIPTFAYSQAKLFKAAPNELQADDGFGYAVSMDSAHAVVTASKADGINMDEGAVWVYNVVNGQLVSPQKLVHPLNQGFTHFGNDAVIYGTHLLVGAYGSNEKGAHAGAVYYYKFNGTSWNMVQKIHASDGKKNDHFGFSIDMSNNRAIIGAPGQQSINHKGKAYAFKLDTLLDKWIEEKIIVPSKVSPNGAFGYDVTIDNGFLAISDPFANTTVNSTGMVEIFQLSNNVWNLDETLSPELPVGREMFGQSIDLCKGTIVIGASGSRGVQLVSMPTAITGAAFVYKNVNSSWRLSGRLTGDGASNNLDRFGYAVSINNDVIAIGCNQDDFMAKNCGSTYVFNYKGNSWTFLNKVLPPDGAENDFFGSSVALFGKNLLVGARLGEEDSSKSNHGMVYFHSQIDIPLAIEDLPLNSDNTNSVLVFPNPITETSLIKINTKNIIEVVSIYDLSGRFIGLLKNFELTGPDEYSFPINQHTLSNGIYIVNVKLNEGSYNVRILKQ